MSSPTPSIDSLLEQCILALEANEQSRVDALFEQHPDQAPQLRERLNSLRSLGILSAPQSSFTIPEQLGEFRLLRQIGRGGMGIVYLAEQPALQRQVALKLVHPEHLFFQGARERFRREVLAVARLQHTGIVPILTCGEANGIPYYAMELVAGASLAEVLAELVGTAPTALDGPTLRSALQRALAKKHELAAVEPAPIFLGAWTNVCTRLVLQVAEALQHAHGQGVLHRDLKPSNLLLTTAGQVRLIDFGLASAEGEQRITRTGATLGSLPYMAPEQVRGDVLHLDARTDIYQLGVTLYELLSLTLPHGDGRGDTRERILAGHVQPPSRRNPQVHADAEAVCLLAMEVDPGRRYQDAAAFADDLGAFLDQRTVRARRPTTWLRLRRWARRRPAAAATAIAAFLVLVPGPLAFALQQSAANARITKALEDGDAQRQRAEHNLTEADHQRELAEQSLGYALNAVETMLLRTAEARLADVPRTARLRRQLLQDAVDFHTRLAAATSDAENPRLRAAKARSQSLLGSLHTDLGELEAALPLLQEARTSFEQLLPTAKDADAMRFELARCNERLATVLGRTGHNDDMEVTQGRALELYRELVAHQATAKYVETWVNAGIAHASMLGRLQRLADAAHELDAIDTRLATDGPATAALPTTSRLELWSLCADTRGILLARNGEIDAAADAFVEALRRLDAMAIEHQNDREVRTARVGLLERIGLAYNQRRSWSDAAPYVDRACAEYEALAKLEPEYPHWRHQLARMLGSRAENRRQQGQDQAAGADHDRAISLLADVVAESPTDGQYRRALALAHAERAGWRHETGDTKGALADFDAAEAVFADMLRTPTDDGPTIANCSAVLANHASALASTGDTGGARARVERALELLQAWPTAEGERGRIDLLVMAADIELRAGDQDAARERFAQAETLADQALSRRPDDRALLSTAAVTALNHGCLLLAADGPEPAIAWWEQHLPIARRAAATSDAGRQSLAVMLVRLADANVRLNRIDAARSWFRSAVEGGIRRADVVRYPPLPVLFDRPDFQDLLPRPADGK